MKIAIIFKILYPNQQTNMCSRYSKIYKGMMKLISIHNNLHSISMKDWDLENIRESAVKELYFLPSCTILTRIHDYLM